MHNGTNRIIKLHTDGEEQYFNVDHIVTFEEHADYEGKTQMSIAGFDNYITVDQAPATVAKLCNDIQYP